MARDFDANDNEQLPPAAYPITLEELQWLNEYGLIDGTPSAYGLEDVNGLGQGAEEWGYWRSQLAAYQQAERVAETAAVGVQSLTRQEAAQLNVAQFPSSDDGMSRPYVPTASNITKQFPATQMPRNWKMHHQSARGGHIAYVSRTEAAYFTRKSSANAFVRSWNEMISHLGSAAEFDQLKMASLLAAVLEAGSGQNGLSNGFNPPLNGH